MEKISILMAAWNAEKTVEQAILSVLAQTWEDWELIVVDDASRDATADVVRALAARDGRICFLENEKNMGVSATRHRALEAATGAWIAILDSDDCWAPEKLEKQMALQKETGGDIFFTGSAFMDAEGRKIPFYLPAPARVSYRQLLRQNVMSNSSVLVRKELYESSYLFGENMHEDFAVWLRILRNGRTAYGIDEPLLTYRLSPDSKTGNKRKAMIMNWNTYRRIGLGLLPSACNMVWYTINGVRKYAGLRAAGRSRATDGGVEK